MAKKTEKNPRGRGRKKKIEPEKHNDIKKFINAIEGSYGLVSLIAKKLKMSWSTAKNYIDSVPEIKEAYENELNMTVDFAVSKLIENIANNDNGAIQMYLRKKGIAHGWGDNTNEITVTQEATVIKWGDKEIKI